MCARANQPQTTSLVIPVEEREQLEEMARQLGFTQSRGAGTRKIGNISALIRAIARGEIKLITATKRKKGESNANTRD